VQPQPVKHKTESENASILMRSIVAHLRHFAHMAKGAEFACPNCGKKNFVPFAQIKKNLKSGTRIVSPCGCSLSPHEIREELAKVVTRELSKRNPKLSK
jgi:predicted RNA-binding Zn-ribbon protein involved in translation (DUF1610 family)